MDSTQLYAVLSRRLTRAVAKTADAVLTVTEFNVTITAGTLKTLTLPESQVAAGGLYTVEASGATHGVSTAAVSLTPNNMLIDGDNYGVGISLLDTEVAVFLSLGTHWIVLMHSTAA